MDITAIQAQIQSDLIEIFGEESARNLTNSVLSLQAAVGHVSSVLCAINDKQIDVQGAAPELRAHTVGLFVAILLLSSQLGLNDEGLLMAYQKTRDDAMTTHRARNGGGPHYA